MVNLGSSNSRSKLRCYWKTSPYPALLYRNSDISKSTATSTLHIGKLSPDFEKFRHRPSQVLSTLDGRLLVFHTDRPSLCTMRWARIYSSHARHVHRCQVLLYIANGPSNPQKFLWIWDNTEFCTSAAMMSAFNCLHVALSQHLLSFLFGCRFWIVMTAA